MIRILGPAIVFVLAATPAFADDKPKPAAAATAPVNAPPSVRSEGANDKTGTVSAEGAHDNRAMGGGVNDNRGSTSAEGANDKTGIVSSEGARDNRAMGGGVNDARAMGGGVNDTRAAGIGTTAAAPKAPAGAATTNAQGNVR